MKNVGLSNFANPSVAARERPLLYRCPLATTVPPTKAVIKIVTRYKTLGVIPRSAETFFSWDPTARQWTEGERVN